MTASRRIVVEPAHISPERRPISSRDASASGRGSAGRGGRPPGVRAGRGAAGGVPDGRVVVLHGDGVLRPSWRQARVPRPRASRGVHVVVVFIGSRGPSSPSPTGPATGRGRGRRRADERLADRYPRTLANLRVVIPGSTTRSCSTTAGRGAVPAGGRLCGRRLVTRGAAGRSPTGEAANWTRAALVLGSCGGPCRSRGPGPDMRRLSPLPRSVAGASILLDSSRRAWLGSDGSCPQGRADRAAPPGKCPAPRRRS